MTKERFATRPKYYGTICLRPAATRVQILPALALSTVLCCQWGECYGGEFSHPNRRECKWILNSNHRFGDKLQENILKFLTNGKAFLNFRIYAHKWHVKCRHNISSSLQFKQKIRKKLFGLHVHMHSCTHLLRPRNHPPLCIWAHIRGRYWSVSQYRRYLFVAPWLFPLHG